MNNTPQHLKDKWNSDTKPRFCLRKDEGNCQGRLTKEHAIIYADKQLQEDWAILDICEFHHGVNNFQDRGDLNKEKHIFLALSRATTSRLVELSKAIDYIALLSRLKLKYDK